MRFSAALLIPWMASVCSGQSGGTSDPTGPPDLIAFRVLETSFDRFVAAYNAKDLPKIRAELAKDAPGLQDQAAFERLFTRYYFADFGALKRRQLLPKECRLDRSRGLLVYVGLFEKGTAIISANFARDAGELKIAQVRFEKVETEE
jgi:hypothetical protein